jgi:hypothetical protein
MKTFFFVAYFIIYTSSVQGVSRLVHEMRYTFSSAPHVSFARRRDLKSKPGMTIMPLEVTASSTSFQSYNQ